MKIVGAEGLDAQTIRDEVARGARLVYYQYCVSIVVMTFKRPSNIYFIRAGQNRILKGLPFALISLVAGWWGFPWGPIYTLETIVNDLVGGKDVTEDLLASLAPAPAAPASAPAAPPPATTFVTGTGAQPSPAKKIAIGVAVVVLLAGAIVGSVCLYRSTHLTVALVAGTAKPYTVELDGTRYQLTPGQPVVLTVAEGRLTLTGGPAGSAPQRFEFKLPLLDHLTQSRVAVINPDRVAIVYEVRTAYHPQGTTPNPDERPTYTVYANEASYFLPAPDYFFADFPKQIQMSQGQTVAIRSRLAQLEESSVEQRVGLLQTYRDEATTRRHLELLAGLRPDDEELLTAISKLKPADARAIFEQRLADRPAHLEWHRYYQDFMEHHFPDYDLVGQYRGLLAAEPEGGAWCYLLGRVCEDPAEARTLNQRALTGTPPCFYAYNGLGVDALSRAEFRQALEYLTAAEAKGVASESVRYNLHLARLAAGEYGRLLADAVAARKAASGSLAAATEEITCSLLAGLGVDAADKVKTEYLATYERTEHPKPKDRDLTTAYLSAVIAYATGDAAGFAQEAAKLESQEYSFEAEVSRGDHAAAAAILGKNADADSGDYLLCYLTAELHHDAAAANGYFARAVELLNGEGRDSRRLGALLSRAVPPSLEEINAINLSIRQKRILTAALGWRYPDRRNEFLTLAKRLNFTLSFPRLLIDQATSAPLPN